MSIVPLTPTGDPTVSCTFCGATYLFGGIHRCFQLPSQPYSTWFPSVTNALLPKVARITVLEGGKTPEVATSRSVGFDLSAAEDVTIGAQSHKLIRLGLIISPPTDMWLMLAARSSLIKRGLILANGIGVVDPDYCGPEDELKLSVFNVTDKTVEVKQGERLAQGMFMPFPPSFTWQHVDRDDIQPDSRGGFGSTGL